MSITLKPETRTINCAAPLTVLHGSLAWQPMKVYPCACCCYSTATLLICMSVNDKYVFHLLLGNGRCHSNESSMHEFCSSSVFRMCVLCLGYVRLLLGHWVFTVAHAHRDRHTERSRLITTRKADGTTFGRIGQSVCLFVCVCLCVCLRVCVCPVRGLTFKSLDLETSFLVRKYIFRIWIHRQVRMSRSSGQGKCHGSKENGLRA